MNLDRIKSWSNIAKFLQERGLVGEKGCMCFPSVNSCDNCRAYANLVNYQQELAQKKYSDKDPVDRFQLSFQDTLDYMKELYGKLEK